MVYRKIDRERTDERDIEFKRPPAPINKPAEKKVPLLDFFIGKDVKVHIRGEKTIEGKLEKTSQYELLLTVNEAPLIIMKHAVDMIELATAKKVRKDVL